MPREINIPAKQVRQEIQSIQEFPESKLINVVVGVIDDEGKFVNPQQFQTYRILDDMYIELNSANPLWNTSKPAGTYFNDDLWHFIDLLNQS
jgi:hypothetical protein